ncbi:Hypothetical protein PFR_JS13-2_669 [Propionibacterium freudenreichii]|nr:Hypothetical protein PFR_JS11_680 [Propionibacterium freudenreichii]SBN95059.1 Hypothetical protein PFR_JS12-2_675 [Propionibacterium freudenreichii]SBT28833.1 Hypothetical protein PFR_JS14_696 [Propionibacterium freudenreichii]SCC96645.1 Hypothetical protein PFR_JS12-1_677 [Propionibacterium freudenreichii]SCQ48042.1 Hypothetical protein PFR_JS13-1_680 [Propionibacterium freudenreichii]
MAGAVRVQVPSGILNHMSLARRALTVALAGACALVALSGCGGSTSTAPASTPGSHATTPTPDASASPSASRKAATTATLPASFEGWTTSPAPSASATQIDSARATLQTAIYQGPAGAGTRILTLVSTEDRGYAASQLRLLVGPTLHGLSTCGTLAQIDNSVSCVVEMDDGLLQVTGTGTDVATLAAFANDLYASLG